MKEREVAGNGPVCAIVLSPEEWILESIMSRLFASTPVSSQREPEKPMQIGRTKLPPAERQ